MRQGLSRSACYKTRPSERSESIIPHPKAYQSNIRFNAKFSHPTGLFCLSADSATPRINAVGIPRLIGILQKFWVTSKEIKPLVFALLLLDPQSTFACATNGLVGSRYR